MREPLKDKSRLEHILGAIDTILEKSNGLTYENLTSDNNQVVAESAVHKNLIQTAKRMKNDGLTTQQISRYTGLTVEEIEEI